MNTDIRLSVDFWEHKKTFRLERQLGLKGVACLVRLWCWAGKHASDGYLRDMDAQDISMAAKWDGESEVFLSALLETKWIDPGDIPYLHDWHDHQPWVIGMKEREEAARIAGKASAEARKAKFGTAQPPNGSRTVRSEGVNESFGRSVERFSNPRTPSPSPLPSPNTFTEVITSVVPEAVALETSPGKKPKKEDKTPPCPHQEILKLYREILPELPQIEWTDDRALQLRTRWREKPDRQCLEWWEKYFNLVRQCPWLMGENERGWIADFEWLTRRKNLPKVLDGKYTDRKGSKQTLFTSKGQHNMEVGKAYLERRGKCETSKPS